MKVIDLLNKIANNDLDTPDYIEYFDRETSKSNKMMVCEENIIYYMNRKALFLNDEVEIIEEHNEEPQEHKIPEKFELHSWGDKNEYGAYVDSPFPTEEEFMNKINEILDYLEDIK